MCKIVVIEFIKSIAVGWSVFCWNFYCEKTVTKKKPRILFDKLNVKRVFWSKKLGFLVLTLEKHSLQSKKHLFARCFSDGETVRPVMVKKSVHVAMSRTVSIYLSIHNFFSFLSSAFSFHFLSPNCSISFLSHTYSHWTMKQQWQQWLWLLLLLYPSSSGGCWWVMVEIISLAYK